MKEVLSAIEKYDGSESHDLLLWQQKVTMYLSTKDLEIYIEEPLKDGSSKEIQRADKKAKSIICTCLSDQLLSSVINEPSAFATWTKIQDTFQKKSRATRTRIVKDFWNLTKGDSPMATYVSNIEALSQKLRSAGKTLDDDDLIDKLLSGLPEQFDPVVIKLNDKPKLQEVISELINYEAQLLYRHREGNAAWEQALNVRASLHAKRYNCKHHHSNSHSDEECWSQHPELRPKRQNNSKQDITHSRYNTTASHVACSASVHCTAKSAWVIDSGCSTHLCNSRNMLYDIKKQDSTRLSVSMANSDPLEIKSEGRYSLIIGTRAYQLNVSYVPGLAFNLLSVSELVSSGLRISFQNDTCLIFDGANLITSIKKNAQNLFILKSQDQIPRSLLVAPRQKQTQLWHQRLGHLNIKDLSRLVSDPQYGIETPISKGISCDGCQLGKMTKGAVPNSRSHNTTRPLNIIHSDIAGPFPVDSTPHSFRYFISFLDQHTRYAVIYPMRRKSDAYDKTRHFINFANNWFKDRGYTIQQIQTDNGSEYLSSRCQELFLKEGILHRTSIPYQPEQNGMIERHNRTVMNCAESMRHHAGLEKGFWWFAVSAAIHLINRRPHSALPERKTPFEAWYGEKPLLDYTRTFGCTAHVHQPKHLQRKLEPKSTKCIFVGYPVKQKGYQFWDPDRKRIITARYTDVHFDEGKFLEHNAQGRDKEIILFDDGDSDQASEPERNNSAQHYSQPQHDSGPPSDYQDNQAADSDTDVMVQDEIQAVRLRKSERQRRAPGEWWRINMAEARIPPPSKACDIDTPLTVSQATNPKNNPFHKEWKAAIDKEYGNLIKTGTWELCHLPTGRRAIDNKWVFKVKSKEDGTVDKFKARLVVKGFSQRPGVDYDETFSPVAHLSSVRLIFALAASHRLKLRQLDVIGAFLQADLHQEIYMKQPEGFPNDNTELVCRLKKSLYGLKQAGLEWNSTVNKFICDTLSFSRLSSDPCVYIRRRESSVIAMALSTDDLLIAYNHESDLNEFLQIFSNRFPITDLGQPRHLLGMRVTVWSGGITLDQAAYIQDMLKRFNMLDCKEAITPIQPGLYLTPEEGHPENVPYRELVGALNWIATCTRPDISTAVSMLSQFCQNPSTSHWTSAKRVLRYLKATAEHGLFYQFGHQAPLEGFVDSDWAGDPTTRRSTSGYIFKLSGSSISWRSTKQPIVTCSTTEAEYVALSEAAREATWLRTMLYELGFACIYPTIINEDNQGCIAISKNRRTDRRTKHIDIRHHYVRDQIEQGTINVQYCPTEKMIADAMTKCVSAPKLKFCRDEMGISPTRDGTRGDIEAHPAMVPGRKQGAAPGL